MVTRQLPTGLSHKIKNPIISSNKTLRRDNGTRRRRNNRKKPKNSKKDKPRNSRKEKRKSNKNSKRKIISKTNNQTKLINLPRLTGPSISRINRHQIWDKLLPKPIKRTTSNRQQMPTRIRAKVLLKVINPQQLTGSINRINKRRMPIKEWIKTLPKLIKTVSKATKTLLLKVINPLQPIG